MGYSTWNHLGCQGVTSQAIRQVAQALIERGLQKRGYTYINIDDCWAVERDSFAKLAPDPVAFPEGMRGIADFVHSQGFKFGLYTDRGAWTCGARPGSADHEHVDAQAFAEWGVDYLKVDSCNAPDDPQGSIQQFMTFRDFLNSTGREIFFALCGWAPWYAEIGPALGNSWRFARDVNGYRELWNAISINSRLSRYAGPGAWNDPDGLIGSTDGTRVKLTPRQSRTQFNLWCIMAAPLMLGADITMLSAHDMETYSNDEAIAVNQDDLGYQGNIVWENCPQKSVSALVREANSSGYTAPPPCQQIWAKQLQSGDWAIAMVNWAELGELVTLDATHLQGLGFMSGVHVRDLWRKADLGMHTDGFHAQVEGAGGSELFRLSAAQITM